MNPWIIALLTPYYMYFVSLESENLYIDLHIVSGSSGKGFIFGQNMEDRVIKVSTMDFLNDLDA